MKRTSLAALIGLSITAIPASAATLTSGHVDFIGIAYDGTDFDPHSHADPDAIVDGSPVGNAPAGEEYAPGDLTVQVYATTGRSAGAAWDPIGVASGETFNFLSETEVAGKPFVGIGAEELTPGDWVNGEITIKLTGMVAPSGAVFSLWQTDAGVPTFFMSTLGGISGADAFLMDLDAEDHAHFGWGFTAEGDYDLTFEISGTHAVDGAKTATATYNFSVIPEPSSALLGAFGALALLRRRRN
jgi:surface-anchored protein